MNKKSNFINNKKNNNRNNNSNQHNNQGFQGGRGRNNNHRMLNQWNNERSLMQRICDGAIVTLLSNAIAAASTTNTSNQTLQNAPSTNTGSSTPSIIEIVDCSDVKDDKIGIENSTLKNKEKYQ